MSCGQKYYTEVSNSYRGLAVRWSKAEIAAEPPYSSSSRRYQKKLGRTLSAHYKGFSHLGLFAGGEWFHHCSLHSHLTSASSPLPHTTQRGDRPCPQVGTVWKGASPHPQRQHPKQQTQQPQLWQPPQWKRVVKHSSGRLMPDKY